MVGTNPSSSLHDTSGTVPTNTPDQFSFKNATFEEVLEDLLSRFILNLPEDELAQVARVCFQIEQAHWYYEDFIRDEKPTFPSLPLKRFSEILFRSCPLLHRWSHDHESAFNDFMEYKTRVPVCGAIMLNEHLTKCVLVKGWKASAGWGFPKGKVNENEDKAYCAVREVLEETGYNLAGRIRRQHRIDLCVKQQPVTLFVVSGIPEDFVFRTQTRKEISKIDWFSLADLPGWRRNAAPTSNHKFYLITPVIHPLKDIVRQLREEKRTTKSRMTLDTALLTSEKGPSASGSEESPVSAQSSSHNCIEVELSSSQSSSIDPHTPLRRADSGSIGLDSPLSKKSLYNVVAEADSAESPLDMKFAVSDNGNHWNRIMSRLSESGRSSSTTDTPHAPTPTPIISSSSPRNILDKHLNRHIQDEIPATWKEGRQVTLYTEQPPRDNSMKRLKQLQLLDSILAEESAKPDRLMSEYPSTAGTRLPVGYSVPIGHDRPSSLNVTSGNFIVSSPITPIDLRGRTPLVFPIKGAGGIAAGPAHGLASARHTTYSADAGLGQPNTATSTQIADATHRNQLRETPGLKAGAMNGSHSKLLSILNNGARR